MGHGLHNEILPSLQRLGVSPSVSTLFTHVPLGLTGMIIYLTMLSVNLTETKAFVDFIQTIILMPSQYYISG